MNREQVKREIRARAWDEIIPKILEPAKNKANGEASYVCPCGHGKNGDGLTFDASKNDKTNFKCFSCGFYGDIFDFYRDYRGMGLEDSINLLASELGIPIDGQDSKTPARSRDTLERLRNVTEGYVKGEKPENVKAKNEARQFIEKAQANLDKFNYHLERGISQETAIKYGLGYARLHGLMRLIIPTGEGLTCTGRAITKATEDKRFRAIGERRVFNPKALDQDKPVFIVEGEIDALSILELGHEAIGLGGKENKNSLIKELKAREELPPLIIAMDNDEDKTKGEASGLELSRELKELGIAHALGADIYQHFNDANECLIAMPEEFKRILEDKEIIAIAEIEAEKERLRAEYIANNSAYSDLQDFIDGVADSVNTPPTPTGFRELDNLLDGGFFEGLYILGALSSVGKTTLLLQISDQIAESGQDVLYISLEMSRRELIGKSISRLTIRKTLEEGGDTANAKTYRGITNGIQHTHYSQEERRLINDCVNQYANIAKHIYYKESIGNTSTEEIEEMIKEHKRLTGQIPIVIIDYLQILKEKNERSTEKQNTDKNVVHLKQISRDYKTPILAISSLNRANYDKPISMGAFKESGAIEYGSDVLLGMQLLGQGTQKFDIEEAKQQDPRKIELKILKNRNGITGVSTYFRYYPKFNYFQEDIRLACEMPYHAPAEVKLIESAGTKGDKL